MELSKRFGGLHLPYKWCLGAVFAPAARKTMKSLYDEYIEACKSELRESTWDKKRRMFESTILPLVGDIKLDRFSVAAAQKFKTEIVSRDIKRTTAGNYCKELSAMLNLAVKLEYIPGSYTRRTR